MKLDSILALDQRVWKRLEPLDLEVCLVPSGMPDLSSQIFGMDPETVARRVCERAFVDFRNLDNGDGHAVTNSLEMRQQLYAAPWVRQQVNRLLGELNQEILLGENGAASD